MKYCLFPNAVTMLITEPTNRSVAPIEPTTIAVINTKLLMRISPYLIWKAAMPGPERRVRSVAPEIRNPYCHRNAGTSVWPSQAR